VYDKWTLAFFHCRIQYLQFFKKSKNKKKCKENIKNICFYHENTTTLKKNEKKKRRRRRPIMFQRGSLSVYSS
jgi:hypothetical protein